MNAKRNSDPNLIDLMSVDEALVMDITDGLRLRIQEYEKSMAKHDGCDARTCTQFKGERRSCAEDMMFLHGQISLIYKLLFEIEDKVHL